MCERIEKAKTKSEDERFIITKKVIDNKSMNNLKIN